MNSITDICNLHELRAIIIQDKISENERNPKKGKNVSLVCSTPAKLRDSQTIVELDVQNTFEKTVKDIESSHIDLCGE